MQFRLRDALLRIALVAVLPACTTDNEATDEESVEDLRRLLNPERARRPDAERGEPEPLPNLGTPVGGVAVIAPGMQAFFDADLAPGEYVLFCMVTAPDGRSHIEHGMIQQITVQ